MSDSDDEDVLLAISSMMVLVSNCIHAVLTDDARSTRFVRPSLSYMQFLDFQEHTLQDCARRIVYDTFRMGPDELDLLVGMCDESIGAKLIAKTVVCVTLHWLATGCSVRAQEQFFLDKSFSQIHMYRHNGLRAIYLALSSNGFYNFDINEHQRLSRSKSGFQAPLP
ncbi:hypothetical protein Ae201684P_017019 [Aphanomyces euteiches]|nr:hypothetical protein Ae201684P_017019 [Aphanomyces euteiches]